MIASLRVQHPLNGEGESGHVAGSLFPISGEAPPVTLQTLLARFPAVTPKILLALAVLAMCDNSVTPQRQCACGCGATVTGKEKTAGPACRKRMQRERDRVRLAALPANRQFNLVLQNELPMPIKPAKFLLCWMTGHKPPRVIYYRSNPEPGFCWGITYDKAQAHRFGSKAEAEARWLSIHQWPEDYQHCLDEGTTWADRSLARPRDFRRLSANS